MSLSGSEFESKIIILGLSQSGKTSIRQVVFEGFAPEATNQNPATVRINRKLFNLAGSGINLFDIGGQTHYLNEIFQQYQERTFSDVKAAIFVVDVSDAANVMRSKYYFDLTIENLKKISSKARIYVFAHKMDVVPSNKRSSAVQALGDIFEVNEYESAKIYGTSIFDDSIWEAMQEVLSFAFPRDDAKTSEIKGIAGKFETDFIALSTSQGLVLYSEPEAAAGINYSRLKNELSKTYFPGMILEEATFSFGDKIVFMKELEEDLVITSVFPSNQNYTETREIFGEMGSKITSLFKPDELLGQAKLKMKNTLAEHLKSQRIQHVEDLEDKFDRKIGFKCDVCGKQLQKSLLEVALDNSEQIDRAIIVSSGFGATTIEIIPIHECIEGIRIVPVFLDNNLEYRRYEKSRPL